MLQRQDSFRYERGIELCPGGFEMHLVGVKVSGDGGGGLIPIHQDRMGVGGRHVIDDGVDDRLPRTGFGRVDQDKRMMRSDLSEQ